MNRRIVLSLGAAAAILAAGCGGGTGPVEAQATPPSAVQIVATGVEFNAKRIEWPPGEPVQLQLINQDAGIPHGLLLATRTSGVEPVQVAELEVKAGPSQIALDVPGLVAGPYLLSCPVHPNMQIEVDVK